MKMTLTNTNMQNINADWLVLGLFENAAENSQFAEIDDSLQGELSRLRERGDLTNRVGDLLSLYDLPEFQSPRILLCGLGKREEFDRTKCSRAFLTVARKISEKETNCVAVSIPEVVSNSQLTSMVIESATREFLVGAVGQNLYQTKLSRFPIGELTFLLGKSNDETEAKRAFDYGTITGNAINTTRELINRSAGDIYPESFAQQVKEFADRTGLECEILDEKNLAEEKMGSLLAVGQGSDRPPRVVILRHQGGGNDAPTLALVGKGVTFDSGGLSLKPTDGMKTMKCDMSGAATVVGAMQAIAELKLPVNVTGYAGLAENMVSGSSYKLGDVLTARNGVTIEVLNTDAEGRLVLADVLALAVDRGAAKIIDLATLTGACVVALGEELTGCFSNNQPWADALKTAAENCGERLWQMPMDDHFAELLKSDVADCKNVGPRWGGAITAAKFLEKFVGKTPWVHLDIAGPAFASSNKPHREGGATGVMVQTLIQAASQFTA